METPLTPIRPALGSHERLLVRLNHRRPGLPRFELERVAPDDPRYQELGPVCFHPANPRSEGRIEKQIVRLSRKLDSLSRRWNATQGQLPLWVSRTLRWLQRWKREDEELLRALCSVEAVRVEYPSAWKPNRARRRWGQMLRSGRNHHLFGLGLSLALLPISLLLTVVPGPNVLGFWFSYRAISHSLSWLGARRAINGGIPVALVPREDPVPSASHSHTRAGSAREAIS